MENKTYIFYVAGMKFHRYPWVKPFIKEGDKVLLIPDPDNKYDPHAVKIIYPRGNKFIMLGHVPMKKDLSRKIAKHLEDMITDDPLAKIGTVYLHAPNAPSYQALKVEVSFNVS